MSGGEPLWRRVAGLYLSGIPTDAAEQRSTRAPIDDLVAPAGEGDADPTQQIIKLGEAIDIVALAQGYRSPAVPLLLRALIRVIRQVAAERADLEAAAAASEAPVVEPDAPQPEAADAPDAEGGKEEEIETPVAEEVSVETSCADTEPFPPDGLEKRVTETDRKLAALTTAVGQLVDVLQRRARNGGGVDRRRSQRLPGGNAKIFVHDHPYEVVNWSQGGFLIRITDADRFSRGGFDFHFVLDLPDETIEFQSRARPVRIERTTLAAEFSALDEATATKINAIATRLARAG